MNPYRTPVITPYSIIFPRFGHSYSTKLAAGGLRFVYCIRAGQLPLAQWLERLREAGRLGPPLGRALGQRERQRVDQCLGSLDAPDA